MSAQGNQKMYEFFKDHGVITPIFDASVRQILLASGAQSWWDDEQEYWHSPRGEYEIKSAIYELPGMRQIMNHDEHMKEMDRTLDLYGLGYDDIGYLTKTLGFHGGSLAGVAWNYVSRNLDVLYE